MKDKIIELLRDDDILVVEETEDLEDIIIFNDCEVKKEDISVDGGLIYIDFYDDTLIPNHIITMIKEDRIEEAKHELERLGI